jgi:effector-binding domain-containing protein
MLDTPQIVQTDEQPTAVIHIIVPRAEISMVMGPAIEEVISTLAAQNIAPTGPCFSYHLRAPSDTFDFEAGFPVGTTATPTGRVKMSRLPAARIVRTIYHGGYEGLTTAWGKFCAWIASAQLNVPDSFWECYTSGPESSPDPDKWCTELNRVLAS